jgi:hypothetical protein
MRLLKWLAIAIFTVFGLSILIVAIWIYDENRQARELQSLCATANVGTQVDAFLGKATKTKFRVRTGGPAGKDEDEWFDREYLRIGRWLNNRDITDDYTVVIAKPGLGYYACVVIHQDSRIISASFEDRSS